jgi:hypothetical protein
LEVVFSLLTTSNFFEEVGIHSIVIVCTSPQQVLKPQNKPDL